MSNSNNMNANSPTTINKWIQSAHTLLKSAAVSSYQLDTLILLEHATGLNQAQLLAYDDIYLSPSQLKQLDNHISRRAKREPLAYIIGHKEFYGRNFIVNHNVLIPRPESESFIELLKRYALNHCTIIDVGCGSGCIGISIKLELPSNSVTLVDIDSSALIIAKQNVRQHNADCNIKKYNLLPIDDTFDIVVANLPYVPTWLHVEPELKYEPPHALFVGKDDMALYHQLWNQLKHKTSCRYVLTESLLQQHDHMADLAAASGYELADTDGLVQMFKNSQC